MLWPAALHLAAASEDGPISKRWRIFRAALGRRL
jgi:hypothetical protein